MLASPDLLFTCVHAHTYKHDRLTCGGQRITYKLGSLLLPGGSGDGTQVRLVGRKAYLLGHVVSPTFPFS